MLVAHLPAGYLAVRKLWPNASRHVMIWGLVGSVLPDIDMLRFLFLDNRQFHHHAYWTHKPLVWAGVLVMVICWHRLTGKPFQSWLKALFMGIFLHILLDTIAGDIRWLWPLYDRGFHLVTVPATSDNWVVSFVTHWTFKVELSICLLAGFVIWRGNRRVT